MRGEPSIPYILGEDVFIVVLTWAFLNDDPFIFRVGEVTGTGGVAAWWALLRLLKCEVAYCWIHLQLHI